MSIENLLDFIAIVSKGLSVAQNELFDLSGPIELDFLKVGKNTLVHLVDGLLILLHEPFKLDYLRVKSLQLCIVARLLVQFGTLGLLSVLELVFEGV